MKILTLHVDYIKFRPIKKALKDAGEVDKTQKEVKDCLVVLTSVEKNDEANKEAIVKRLIHEINDIASQIKTKSIVLYPYAHLSSNLASPKDAQEILDLAEKELKKDFSVTKAPFGWYKEFELKAKGHPLAELSREFVAEEIKEEKVSTALKDEKKLRSHWHIITPDGKLHEYEEFDYFSH